MKILGSEYFKKDVLELAPDLLGKYLARRFADGRIERFRIVEVEAYRGEEDKACHASKGRTKRTEVMYHTGGRLYIYLIYGMHYMLNIVTGEEGQPQAILIRAVEGAIGPGRLTKRLAIGADFYGERIPSDRIWVEDLGEKPRYTVTPRIGVDYAGDWKAKLWRFVASGY